MCAYAISDVQDERFWAKTKPEGECLVWTGSRDKQGYGRVMREAIAKSPTLAHRYAWMLLNGPIPEGAVVRHTCDNPPCVKGEHLLCGTQADNIADRQARGRHRPGHLFGEEHPAHKLNDQDVIVIRWLWKAGVARNQQEIADYFRVHVSTVHRIVTGQGWGHIPELATVREKAA